MRVEVRTSGIWQLNSVVLSDRGEVAVVDAGYFPRELDELRALADARGALAALAFTHAHWDHVVGWRWFPRAPVWTSVALADAVREGAPLARASLADAARFDGEWYVRRPGPYAWPDALAGLADGATVAVGDATLDALHLPGHSADGLGLVARGVGVLVAGDHLSPCEIPFVDALDDYRATLARLRALLDGVARVVPGHGATLSRAEAVAIAEADAEYLAALADCRARDDAPAALALRLPRARDTPGMDLRHRENVAAALGRPHP